MKIVISATEGSMDAMVDPRFGRAAWLLILETETGELIEAIDNSTGKEAAHGAGISVAALVADKGVRAVLTGRVGPKALVVLEKADIQIVDTISGSVAEALASFADGSGATASPSATTDTTAKPGAGNGCGPGCGQGRGMGQGKGMGQGRGQCRRG